MIVQRVTFEKPVYIGPDEELSVKVVDNEKCVVTITRGDVAASTEMGCTLSLREYGEWIQA